MAVFKCKMCGGNILFEIGMTVGVCDSCETKQTLPKLDDEHRANMYDRANHFRRNNDYDKATAIYEKILNEDATDAEAYWSLVLCRFGIEYVEDPATGKRVPTVNRTQFTSIFDDANYKNALKYADSQQRDLYVNEAAAINEIQKGILAISQKENPFDVFICYKETDNQGRRTPDSVLATDLYYQLKQEGFEVFFSRITLEDKLGVAYEPYIFAALNSAKVMVVLGTKKEYFEAVWVKNEWSRYLSLVRNGDGKKTLIPAFRDMDPYDLPEEFSHLQALDMTKLGFMSDLVRGIKKLTRKGETNANESKAKYVGANLTGDVNQLLRRAFVSLEYGEWDEANKAVDKVLDLAPENAQAYLAKLMSSLKIRKQEELANCEKTFEDNSNYKRAIRFGDEKFKHNLESYVTRIHEREELKRKETVYNEAISMAKNVSSTKTVRHAIEMLESIKDYKNASNHADVLRGKIGSCERLDRIYETASMEAQLGESVFNRIQQKTASIEEILEARDRLLSAIRQYERIERWEDSMSRIGQLRLQVKALSDVLGEKEQELRLRRKARNTKIRKVIGLIVLVSIILIGLNIDIQKNVWFWAVMPIALIVELVLFFYDQL